MGRKKNPENKSRIEDIREKLEESKQNHLSSNFAAPKLSPTELSARDAFTEFWTRARKKYNRPRELEDVLWEHLKSSGHDKPHLFDEGLTHFGLKVSK
jgi:hypothetical protein